MAPEKPTPTGSTNLLGEWRIIFEINFFKRKGLLSFCRDLLASVDKNSLFDIWEHEGERGNGQESKSICGEDNRTETFFSLWA